MEALETLQGHVLTFHDPVLVQVTTSYWSDFTNWGVLIVCQVSLDSSHEGCTTFGCGAHFTCARGTVKPGHKSRLKLYSKPKTTILQTSSTISKLSYNPPLFTQREVVTDQFVVIPTLHSEVEARSYGITWLGHPVISNRW